MKDSPMTGSRPGWIRRVRLSASGVSDSPLPDCLALRRSLEVGVKPAFPPSLVVQVKALACELPHTLGLPLSRLSVEEIRRHVILQGLVAEISGATLWRWLSSDALCPGNIEAGSSLAIRTLPAQPGPSSIFTNASGRLFP